MLTRPEWYFHFGKNALPQLEEVTLRLKYAPDGWSGMTALFVTDVHLGPFAGRDFACALAERMRAAKADILLLGGDYGENAEMQRCFFESMATLSFPMGKFAVVGNNDAECECDKHVDLYAEAEKSGVRILRNERAELLFPGGRILLGGVDECKYGKPDARNLFEDARETDSRILLSHYPLLPEGNEKFGSVKPEVILSGHTHGGQINFAGITPYTLRYEAEIAGMSHVRGWKDKRLVSSGIGYSKIPLRVGARPVMHRIRFEREA